MNHVTVAVPQQPDQREPGKRGETVCFAVTVGGMPITLTQQGVDRFTVTYWKQVKAGLSYGKAAAELGAAIMHASACEGCLDNREPGER